MFKRILLLLLLISVHYIVNAQSFSNQYDYGEIGISFSSFGESDLVYLKTSDEVPKFEGVRFYAFDICYFYPLNEYLDIESGVGISFHKLIVTPHLPPNVEVLDYEENVTLVNIPLNVRLNFLYNFFINGGGLINLDFDDFSSIHKQTGLGVNFGIGYKYDFELGISVFLNPYAKVSTLLPFRSLELHQRLIEYGVRFGVVYSI
jgi:hypothetical protein